MKLAEIIAAVILVSLLSPVFVGALRPILRLSNETRLLKNEFNTNQFISGSFRALSKHNSNFEKWRALVYAATGCQSVVIKIGETKNSTVYRAQWNYGEKPLFVDAAF